MQANKKLLLSCMVASIFGPALMELCWWFEPGVLQVNPISEVYIRHVDVQLSLQRLRLPFVETMSHDQPSVVLIPDEESITDDFCEGSSQTRRPLAPISDLPRVNEQFSLDFGSRASSSSDMNLEALGNGSGCSLGRQPPSLSPMLSSSMSDNGDNKENQLAVVVVDTDAGDSGAHCQRALRHRNMSAMQLANLSEDDYRHMSAARMSVVAGQCSRELRKALAKAKASQATSKGLKRKLTTNEGKFDKKIKKLEERLASISSVSTLEVATKGKSGKRLTTLASIAVGLRRNFSNIAAGDFGAVILRDISANTVIRSEIKCAASIAMDMRWFSSQAISSLRLEGLEFVPDVSGHNMSSCHLPWSLMLICIRSDATNSSIWRREKLSLLEAEVGIVKTPIPSLDKYTTGDLSWLSRRRCLYLDARFEGFEKTTCGKLGHRTVY